MNSGRYREVEVVDLAEFANSRSTWRVHQKVLRERGDIGNKKVNQVAAKVRGLVAEA